MSQFPSQNPSPPQPPAAPRTYAETLHYAPPLPGRPGMVTAIAVLSIVVGSISMLVSGGSIVQDVAYLTMAKAGAAFTPIAPTTIPAGSGQTSAVSYPFVASGSGTSATAPAASWPGIPAAGVWKQVRLAGVCSLLASLASLGLAVFLLVIGIGVLRRWKRGRKHHLIYAWAKIPVTLVAAVTSTWLSYSFMQAMMGAASPFGGQFGWIVFAVSAGVQAMFSMMYPIGLLITLHTRAVRMYFATLET